MYIPENATILAPASLHLALYQQILKQNNNCLNIQVLTLKSYISSFYTIQQSEEMEILYQYKDALNTIREDNLYYSSIEDSTFLRSCYQFIKWHKLYNTSCNDLPDETIKEKDLKEILEILYQIPVFEDSTSILLNKIDHCESVYILKKGFSKDESFWVQSLIQKGAHYLENDILTEHHYFSCADNRKQAELVASIILENNYNAQDIYIATNSEPERQVISQIFDLHHIPYTNMQQACLSSVADEWIAVFKWIAKPDLNTYLNLIKVIYSYSYKNILDYFTAFPDNFKEFHPYLSCIEYEKNALIDEVQFNYLKNLEQYVSDWLEEHEFIYRWNFDELDVIATFIQSLHKTVTKEDLSVFKSINTLCCQAKPYIHKNTDLSLLIEYIDGLKASKADSLKGVLIGSKENISSIRPIHFIAGAHHKNYPALSVESGLFNEEYVAKCNLPDLQSRLDLQGKQVKDLFFLSNTCFMIYPQSDYEGNSYESSEDIKQWTNTKPVFKAVEENSIYEINDFKISSQSVNNLFFNQNHFSVSRLETFAKCPFEHFIKYGLHLKEKKEWTDITVAGTILHSILEKISAKYNKEYAYIQQDEINHFVEEEFQFALKVYPNKERWIQEQIKEYTYKISQVLLQLQIFEKEWHMNIKNQEYRFEKSIEWNEMIIHFVGYIDRVDTSNTSFCVFDYKSGKRELKVENFQSGLSLQLITYTLSYKEKNQLLPVGSFYISLSSPYSASNAYKVTYPRKKDAPITMDECDLKSNEEFIKQKFINGWDLDGFDNYLDEENKQITIPKNKLSIKEQEEQWPIIIHSLLNEMQQGDIHPDHVSDACTYCQYERICRNARQEIKRQSYISQEE